MCGYAYIPTMNMFEKAMCVNYYGQGCPYVSYYQGNLLVFSIFIGGVYCALQVTCPVNKAMK
jgi:hypothetical protein